MSKVFESFVSETVSRELKVSNGKIQQTQRNELKESATLALLDVLTEQGVDAFRTTEGVVIAIDNTTTKKTVYITVDPVIKGTDYDLDEETQAYEDKVAERAERERLAAEKKAAKVTKPKKAE